MFCGVGSKDFALLDGCAAFVVLEDHGGIRGGGDFGAVGCGGGDEFTDGAVGGLEVGLCDAGYIVWRDLGDFVTTEEQGSPVTFADCAAKND